MNPDRISKISVTMVRWMRQRWGADVVCGLDLSRLPTYVDAIKTRVAVENFPLFGFIDCTLTRARRVKYGHAVPWTCGV
jgi:hypothetical protein